MGWIGREHMRDELAQAQAVRMAGLGKDDWLVYQRDIDRMTREPHG